MVHSEFNSYSPTGSVLSAMRFAAYKHRDQRRKNPGRTPYINHPLDLAYLLWFDGGVRDEDVLVAAILHDTVEDTATTFAELESEFGPAVRYLVEEVTDDSDLTSQERKRRQVEKASQISHGAKLVKLADKISNLRDVREDPPEGWSVNRRTAYARWAKAVVDGLRGVNPPLEAIFDEVYRDYFRETEMIVPSGMVESAS